MKVSFLQISRLFKRCSVAFWTLLHNTPTYILCFSRIKLERNMFKVQFSLNSILSYVVWKRRRQSLLSGLHCRLKLVPVECQRRYKEYSILTVTCKCSWSDVKEIPLRFCLPGFVNSCWVDFASWTHFILFSITVHFSRFSLLFQLSFIEHLIRLKSTGADVYSCHYCKV